MDTYSLLEQGRENGLYTDYGFCVRGRRSLHFRGGTYIAQGAKLFDIASLTKACVHLVFWKLFAYGWMTPDDSYTEYVDVPQLPGDDRKLRNFLSYTAQSYVVSEKDAYESLQRNSSPRIKEELLRGFGPWIKRHMYDNITSAYMGILLEKYFKENLQTILWEHLLGPRDVRTFLFHPTQRGMSPQLIVPTRHEEKWSGRVFDPMARVHDYTTTSIAGLFSTEEVLADIFHQTIGEISESFYRQAAQDQVASLGMEGPPFGLGFDIPGPERFEGIEIENPLLFTGYTGGRIFFAQKPRVTVALLTNFSLDRTEEKLKEYKAHCWKILREAVKMQY